MVRSNVRSNNTNLGGLGQQASRAAKQYPETMPAVIIQHSNFRRRLLLRIISAISLQAQARTRFTILIVLVLCMSSASAQIRSYPKEVRGYKVERAVVEIKPSKDAESGSRTNDLIRFGDPKLVKATPVGLSLEIPIIVSPVTQKGTVNFLVFEDMEVNGTSVTIEDYEHKFDLPGQKQLVLKQPLKIFITLPSAILAAVGEWTDSKEIWPVKGRVYVFGKFKKAIFNFKRCIPIELDLAMRNPMRRDSGTH